MICCGFICTYIIFVAFFDSNKEAMCPFKAYLRQILIIGAISV